MLSVPLIVTCVCNSVGSPWKCTAVQLPIAKNERTDNYIVFDVIVHFISILNVYTCPSNVVKHILFNQ